MNEKERTMGGLLVVGIVLALMGFAIMAGLMQVFIDFSGNIFIIGGIIGAVGGGAAVLFGQGGSKVWGVGLS